MGADSESLMPPTDVDVDFHARVHEAILAKMFFNCT